MNQILGSWQNILHRLWLTCQNCNTHVINYLLNQQAWFVLLSDKRETNDYWDLLIYKWAGKNINAATLHFTFSIKKEKKR